MPSRFVCFISVIVILLSLPDVVLGQEMGKFSGADTAWVLTAMALVLFMTIPALALFYGGLVRSLNVLSILMHCFVICWGASAVWLQLGLKRRQ